jgi:hypothetical protein
LTKQHATLESWIHTIKEKCYSKAKEKIKTPCFGHCVVCPLKAQGTKDEKSKRIRLHLAYHARTGLPWSIGDGDDGRDNFRIQKSKLNLCWPPTKAIRNSSESQSSDPGLEGKVVRWKEKGRWGNTCAPRARRRTLTKGASPRSANERHRNAL